MIDREPAPGPAEPGHHLVADHQDPVAVAQLAHALDVAIGRDQDAVRPDDRLEEHGGDRVRPLVADDVLEALQRLRHGTGFCLSPAMRIGVADDADQPGLVRPAARVAGEGHRPHGRPVIRPVASEHLVATRDVARELDRVLDRLGATEREEDLVHVAGQDLCELLTQPPADLGREQRRLDVLELGRLLGDGVDDAPIAVADVDRHQLAVEIEDALSFGRIQPDALGVVDDDRIDGPLDRPREEGMCAVEGDDLR